MGLRPCNAVRCLLIAISPRRKPYFFPRRQKSWHAWRAENLLPIQFPVEGFGAVHGQPIIDAIDNHPLGATTTPRRTSREASINNRKNANTNAVSQKRQHQRGTTTRDIVIINSNSNSTNTSPAGARLWIRKNARRCTGGESAGKMALVATLFATAIFVAATH